MIKLWLIKLWIVCFITFLILFLIYGFLKLDGIFGIDSLFGRDIYFYGWMAVISTLIMIPIAFMNCPFCGKKALPSAMSEKQGNKKSMKEMFKNFKFAMMKGEYRCVNCREPIK